jgi:putative ABC transport system permease protein
MKFFPLIWCNLMRKKTRTALTLLSIVVAFVLFGFLSAIKQALAGGISMAGANRLMVRHKISIIQLLPESYKGRMEKIPGVSLVTHQTFFGGVYQEFVLPPAQKAAWLQTRIGAIVGRKTAERFRWKIGDRVPLLSSIWDKSDGGRTWEFEIVGIFDGRDPNTDTTPFLFRYDYFDESRRSGWGKGQVGWFTIRVTDPARAGEIAKLVDAEFENSSAETKTEPEGAFVQAWVKQIGDIALITASILGAVFFTILLVTGNTISQSVRERTGELGVLKAIGFTNGQVLVLVLLESCLLSVLGGVLGLGIGKLLTAGGDPTGGMLPRFLFTNGDLGIGLGASVALGLVTGVFPAVQAMRLKVADALRRI